MIHPCLLFFLFFLPLPNAVHSSFWKRIQGQILNRLQELMPNRPFLSISLLVSTEYKVQVPINLSLKQGLKANINYGILHIQLHKSKKVFHVLRFNF